MKTGLIAMFLLIVKASSSQTTQAEIDAMMKKIQKQTESVLNDPKIKKLMAQPGSVTIPERTTTHQKKKNNLALEKIPEKDIARFQSVPKKIFSPVELSNYLTDLYTQFSKKLPAGAVSSVTSIITKLGNDVQKMEATAVSAWYNGAVEEAVLLITKAAINAKNDGLLLTNAAAILDMSGLPEKAIPILRTVINNNEDNAIALNNQGQAFAQLGFTDSAMYYLGRCIKISPQHPEANNTAGLIELKKGNTKSAEVFFETSLKGGFNLTALHGLESASANYKIARLIRPKIKYPEYFNQFKYKLPPQCYNVANSIQLNEEHQAFKRFLTGLIEKYERLEKEAAAQFQTVCVEKVKNDMLVKKKNPFRPFQVMATFMMKETLLDYGDDISRWANVNTRYNEQIKLLRKERETALKNASCPQADGINNSYLAKFAQLTEDWQQKRLLVEKKYFDELLHWYYLGSFEKTDFLFKFYSAAKNYLVTLRQLCIGTFFLPCNTEQPVATAPLQEEKLEIPDCPIDIEIPLAVGKIKLSCEKFSFSAGEGLLFKYEKSFSKRQSTMILGIGYEYELKPGIKGAKAGVEAGAGMNMFLNFDNNGNVSDAGFQYGVKASAGVDFEAGEKVKIKGGKSLDASLGWRFGVNSGIGFDEGPLTYILNPQEKQINKNVNIYKPKG